MKKILIALLVLLSVMTSLVLGSCSSSDVKTKVHLTIVAGEFTIFDKDVTVKTSADNTNGPSVIDLLYAVIEQDRAAITISEDESTVDMIAVYPTAEVDGVEYLWTFKINNKDVAGNENENFLKDGDKVVYRFMMLNDRGDPVAYDNSTNVFEKDL